MGRTFKSIDNMVDCNDFQYLSEKKLLQWGIDGAQNYGYDIPTTVEEAIEILHDIGDVIIEEVVSVEDGE